MISTFKFSQQVLPEDTQIPQVRAFNLTPRFWPKLGEECTLGILTTNRLTLPQNSTLVLFGGHTQFWAYF